MKEKAEKVYFYLRHNCWKNESGRDFQQGQIWGTIAYKNQKGIMTGTQRSNCCESAQEFNENKLGS
jgi:hypothetical protein